jgi:2Fe-2S ferredoxin
LAQIIFKKNEIETVAEMVEGTTLLDLAKQNNVKLLGGCDGAGVCGTCHVYIDQEHFEVLEVADEGEQELLELLPNAKPNSRLACQIVLDSRMDGMVVTIP